MTESSLKALIENGRDELIVAPFIQSETEMIDSEDYLKNINRKLFALMHYIEKSSKEIPTAFF